jgi:hypothetical protein
LPCIDGNNDIGFGIVEAFINPGAAGAISASNETALTSTVEILGGNFIGVKGRPTNLDGEEIF